MSDEYQSDISDAADELERCDDAGDFDALFYSLAGIIAADHGVSWLVAVDDIRAEVSERSGR